MTIWILMIFFHGQLVETRKFDTYAECRAAAIARREEWPEIRALCEAEKK